MRRIICAGLLLAALVSVASPVAAAVNVERQGSENAFIEVARTTGYGALLGLLVGSAISLAQDNSDGEAIRWGIVFGTFAGLGYGIVHVNSRPKPSALLELGSGAPSCGGFAAIEAESGTVRVRAVSLRF